MLFAHIADCHLGSWRQPELQELSTQAFAQAINKCIKKNVDCVLVAGDLFDSALPSIDVLKKVVGQLKKLKDNNIACYVIAGSHDYSVSGKTFLDVLEKAGLCENAAKFKETADGVIVRPISNKNFVIAGLPGKKAGLERNFFKNLRIQLQEEKKPKIFMLHTTLTEAKPDGIDFLESVDANMLPKGFSYYAAGHLHVPFRIEKDKKLIVYPGCLFPNSFSEFEKIKYGSFCFVDLADKIKIEKQEIKLRDVLNLCINVDGLSADNASKKITEEIKKCETKNKIVTLRIEGELASGKTTDLRFEEPSDCYLLLKNSTGLTSKEFKIEKADTSKSISQIEKEIITRYIQKKEQKGKGGKGEKEFNKNILQLIEALDTEKQEGEKNTVFEQRIKDEMGKIFGLEK